jgi:hypothetical protein
MNAVFIAVLIFIVLLIFTKNLLYCIIALIAAALAITGFIIMIKTFDSYVAGQKRGALLIVSLSKLTLITTLYYLLSLHSMIAVMSFTLGLLIIVGGIMVEGAFQMYTGLFNGRT